jgi:hypothetical protein
MTLPHAYRPIRPFILLLSASLLVLGSTFATAAQPTKSDPMSDALMGKPTPPPDAAKPAAAAPAAADKPAGNGPPTTDDVQQALDHRDFSTAAKLASKLLALKGVPAAGLDRFQLWTMKGDAQIGQKLISNAIESYTQALKETSDPQQTALVKSTVLLLHHATGSTYVPKSPPAPGETKTGPLDLTDHDKRKQAFGALLTDLLVPLQPKIKSAMTSQSVVAIWPVLQQLEELEMLDQLANGNTDKTTQAVGGLSEHARTLITTALKGMWQRLDDIDKAANHTTNMQQAAYMPNGGVYTHDTPIKAGLTDQNKHELNDIIHTCQQVQDAANAFSQSAGSDKDKDWASVTSDANRVSSRANDLLNANYSDITNPSNYNSVYGNGYNNAYNGAYGGTTIYAPAGAGGPMMITGQQPTTINPRSGAQPPPTTRGSR